MVPGTTMKKERKSPGKILYVNLSTGKVWEEPLERETIANWVGGRGLGDWIFIERLGTDPRVEPLSGQNAIVFATSPLTGTPAPTAGRGHAVFKSPLTGTIGSSNSGGDWAVYLRKAGVAALVVLGKAEKPCYILITENSCDVLDAGELWGKDIHETTSLLLDEHGKKGTRVLAIGPAGENLVRFAGIANERNRFYGRGGPGAVMGSKNLKAVVVNGNMKTEIEDPLLFESGREQALYRLKAAPGTKRILRELGTSGLVKLIDQIDMLPARNFRTTVHKESDLDKICGETIRKRILKKPGACFRCPIACQRHTTVGNESGEGPEFETVVLLGPVCGIYDLEAITLANYMCNKYGMDTISFGGTLAAAMELNENGAIPTGGPWGNGPKFGDTDFLLRAAEATAFGKGFGKDLGQGSLRLCKKYGHPEFSMTVKGLEMPAYDPRASFVQALGYMTSPTGACHLRGGYAVSLAFFGGPKEIPRFSIRQAPVAVRNVQDIGIIQDSLGICRFTAFAFTIDTWARMASGASGMDMSKKTLERVAERIASLERTFNLEAGFTAEDDTLPERFTEESIYTDGRNVNIPREVIERMRSGYYKVRGWNEEGIP